MNFSQLFSLVPLWVLLMSTVLLFCCSFEGGFFIGKYRNRRSHKEKESPVGPMIGATLSLLAFMLSFTFGIAASHFYERQQTVAAEASAIRSAYNMAGLLSEPDRKKIRQLLREYVSIRTDPQSINKIKAVIARSEEIQDLLWDQAMKSEVTGLGLSASSLLIQSLDDIVNLHVKRVSVGSGSNIPTTIWVVLYGIAILAIAGMGYHAGLLGHRSSFAYTVLILTFSAVLVLISDLDRSRQGLFRVSQQPMFNLQTAINADPL